MPEYFEKVVRAQQRLAPFFRIMIDNVGYFALLAGGILLMDVSREIAKHQFDRQDALLLLVHVPFISFLIHLIAQSRK